MNTDNGALAYDLQVECCGETFHVRRTLDLARRVEQTMGPIYTLVLKLRTMGLTIDERATLLCALLKDERHAPTMPQVREWLFLNGMTTGPALAAEVLTLIAGNEAVVDHDRRRRGEQEGAEPAQSPFARTAG